MTFTATVRNQGDTHINAGTIIGVNYTIEGQVNTWGSNDQGLAAGESRNISVSTNSWQPNTSGAYLLVAHVDDVDRILESNEGNNSRTLAISVSQAPEPLPPIEPTPGRSKLTIHSGGGNLSLHFIRETQPGIVKILDNFSFASDIKSTSPNTIIIGRSYSADEPTTGDPVQRANEWWARFGELILANPDIDYWEGYNEPNIGSRDALLWYSQFEAERVRILAANGKRAVIGNFSTGTPDVTDPQMWPQFYAAIDSAIQYGGILGLHEYGTPMQQYWDESVGEGWLVGRYRKIYRQHLIPDNKVLPVVFTESGVDVVQPIGWKNHFTEQEYIDQLIWYDNILKQDDYVLGSTIFALEIPGWESFDIAPILDPLIRYISDTNAGQSVSVSIPSPSEGSQTEPSNEPITNEPELNLLPSYSGLPPLTQGVRYRFYHGDWNQIPNFNAISPANSGYTNNFNLGNRDRDDYFGFQFNGYLNVPSDGEYVFYTNSDDGSQLFIDGHHVVNNDGLHGPQEVSGRIALQAGQHEIVVTFFEKTGGELLNVSWQGPGTGKQIIPNAVLFRQIENEPETTQEVSDSEPQAEEETLNNTTNNAGAIITSVSSVSAASYQSGTLSIGQAYYIDRNYTLTSVPTQYANAELIRTANDDKHRQETHFLTLSLSQNTTLCVAYDGRASQLPNWLSAWSHTDQAIGTTDVNFDVFCRRIDAGSFTLGANNAEGANGYDSHYILFALPTNSISEQSNTESSGLADLVVERVWTEPSSPLIGETVTFFASVRNNGTQTVDQNTITGVGYVIDGQGGYWGSVTQSLTPGESVTISTQSSRWIASSAGAFELVAIADDVNRIQESNEHNNTMAITISASEPVPNFPDLIVENVRVIMNGDQVSFESTIRNTGNMPTPSGTTIGVSYWVNGQYVTWGASDQALAPNTTMTIGSEGGSITYPGSGNYAIEAFVDDVNRIEESDENNNRRGININL